MKKLYFTLLLYLFMLLFITSCCCIGNPSSDTSSVSSTVTSSDTSSVSSISIGDEKILQCDIQNEYGLVFKNIFDLKELEKCAKANDKEGLEEMITDGSIIVCKDNPKVRVLDNISDT